MVECLHAHETPAELLITGALDPHIGAGSPSANYANFLETRIADSCVSQHLHLLGKTGPLSPKDMTSLYQVCDAVILPSESEGFGLPALEAALHNKPFLCNAIAPLENLPGTTPLDLHAPDARDAVKFLQDLMRTPTVRARKSVLSEHRWQSIYERAIAPVIVPAN